jgi:hypothetical protein
MVRRDLMIDQLKHENIFVLWKSIPANLLERFTVPTAPELDGAPPTDLWSTYLVTEPSTGVFEVEPAGWRPGS